MSKAEILAAIYMASNEHEHLKGLSDWVKQYDTYVEDFKSIIERLEPTSGE